MPAAILDALLAELAPDLPVPRATFHGRDPVVATRLRIGAAAAAALAGCGSLAADLWAARGGRDQRLTVDVRAAATSLLSFLVMRGPGLEEFADARARNTIALYPTRDQRWIHLHGGFPHLRDGLLTLLGCPDERDAIARAVAQHDALELEDLIAERRLCGAVVRTGEEWDAHPQGAHLASTPAVWIERIADSPAEPLPRGVARPLEGVRVLDLTRVLAGPTCARTLAEHGAEVLRIDGPHLPRIAAFVLDTSHGKRRAGLDLRRTENAEQLRSLVRDCDVFSQGYRAGALEARGFGPAELAVLRPGIVVVSVNAYGHGGPWQGRAGWEQLAQTVSGIAAEQGAGDEPQLLPAAACDYTTGYLGALGALVALRRRTREGGSWHVRVSLCQTARWLRDLGRADDVPDPLPPEALAALMRTTPLKGGVLTHLGPVVQLSETPARWDLPTGPACEHPARWLG